MGQLTPAGALLSSAWVHPRALQALLPAMALLRKPAGQVEVAEEEEGGGRGVGVVAAAVPQGCDVQVVVVAVVVAPAPSFP